MGWERDEGGSFVYKGWEKGEMVTPRQNVVGGGLVSWDPLLSI